ncbi:CFI-box-CTERM domain-containing protein [Suipraeoptans intestinalis]|uniref:CFI-box-CTERM domain-containing protein n=1 Tax=Suipraeoptans intestinalis TaxID=2606628 RepID=UPI002A74E62C|nr:CFI-box-CTERM domain-containing protein [Suipraeoptans intestinalis]MDY3122082.1 CFI-box-CTERM domain-containing protein [Suipraeoptans intestinalis]
MKDYTELLPQLFEEMLGQIKYFKKKTYQDLFESLFEKHRPLMEALQESYESEEDFLDRTAGIIPDYAQEKLSHLSKGKREVQMVDYNMSMAVYIVPLLKYSRQEGPARLAKEMVIRWNEKKMMPLILQESSYEEISGGFKKGFCYITTAICKSRGLPDDCEELTMLRSYRDTYLLATEEGRMLVEDYYDTAPALVQCLDMRKDAARIYERLYKKELTECLSLIRAGQNEMCKERYVDMVKHLQRSYGGTCTH